jgi:TolA-binding protein
MLEKLGNLTSTSELTLENIGFLIGFAEISRGDENPEAAEKVLLAEVGLARWETLRRKEDSSSTNRDTMETALHSAVARMRVGGRFSSVSPWELELIEGYVRCLRAHHTRKASTDRLETLLNETVLAQAAQVRNFKEIPRIGRLLLEAGFITTDQRDEAIRIQQEKPGPRLGTILKARGYVTEKEILSAIARSKRNYRPYIIAALLAAVGLFLALLIAPTPTVLEDLTIFSTPEPESQAAADSIMPPRPPRPAPTADTARAKREIERSPEEKTLIAIEDQQLAIAQSTDPNEIASHLYNIGNLCFTKLKDYEQAIENFSQLVSSYPETDQAKRAYPNIARCFILLGDTGGAESTYSDMLRFFPEGSSEHDDALEGLGWE